MILHPLQWALAECAWLHVLIVSLCIATTQCANLRNVALKKPAVIDSLYAVAPSIADAEHAVDGDSTKTDLWDLSCAHSSDDSVFPKWWIVDLLRPYEIHKVLITNRDSYHGRLQNFTIDVFDTHPNAMLGFPNRYGTLCHHENSFPGPSETATYTCGSPVIGRYLRVIKYGHWSLVMCEVQVMAVANQPFRARRIVGLNANIPAYSTVTVASYLKCAVTCGQDDNCNTFTWNKVTLQCGLLKVTPYKTSALVPQVDADTDLTSNFQIDV